MKAKIIRLFVLSFLLIACLALQNAVIAEAKLNFPNAVCCRSDGGMNVNFADLKDGDISLISAKSAVFSTETDTVQEKVDLYYTDENLYKRVPMRFLSGNFFIEHDGAENNKYAVISDKLAVQFFLNEDAAGTLIFINGEEYIICGVYESADGFLSEISDNGREKVFVPFKSQENWRNMPCNFLLLNPSAVPFTGAFDDVIYEKTGKVLSTESKTSYPDLLLLFEYLQRLFWLIAGITLIAVLLRLVYRKAKICYASRHASRKELWRNMGVAVALIGASAAIWVLISFKPVLPSSVLPPENLFDISHYLSEYVASLQDFHSHSVFDFWRSYSFAVGEVVFSLGVVEIVLYGMTLWELCKVGKS